MIRPKTSDVVPEMMVLGEWCCAERFQVVRGRNDDDARRNDDVGARSGVYVVLMHLVLECKTPLAAVIGSRRHSR